MTLDNRGRPNDQPEMPNQKQFDVNAPQTTTTTTTAATTTATSSTPAMTPATSPPTMSPPTNRSAVPNNDTLSSPPRTAANRTVDIMSPSAEELIDGFPDAKLRSLIMKISNSRWVVPVLPDQELECLLNYAIRLTKAGVDHECESCVRFYRESLYISFMKILTDEAVNSWKYNIHYCILNTCGKLLQLCALHMKRDNAFLLDLLAIVLDPENKFNTFYVSRPADQYVSQGGSGSSGAGNWGVLDERTTFARSPPEPKSPRGWLVDMINRFGQFGGFDNLLERFNTGIAEMNAAAAAVQSDDVNGSTDKQGEQQQRKVSSASTMGNSGLGDPNNPNKITLHLIHSLLRPFGQCYELLTVPTIERYFMPIWEVVLGLIDGLSDEDLKREAKPEGRSDSSINGIAKAARALASRLPNQEHLIKELEMFRLKMILRLLKVSGFNGKMNALNEINKMLSAVSYLPHRMQPCGSGGSGEEEMDWLTAERMAAWIKETDVLGIVLQDSLHQTQYVEKLERIIRFLIKEQALTLDDLDAVWRAQDGKHETIVKNVHDLLAKLAWDFNAEQLDHLFDCFEASMSTANKRQRDRLLELIRRLAEDDKIGVMAHKVLKRFWQLAHSPDISHDVLDQALGAHVKILDYSCSKEKDAQKAVWLDKCVHEVKTSDAWVLPALRLIREICCLYESSSHVPRMQNLNRLQVIERLQTDHSLVILVTNSLTSYLDRVRALVKDNPELKAPTLILSGRYPHPQQIQERLDFLKFLLKDGQLWLCAEQAKQIWNCLAVNAVFPSDREECFRWFGKLMGEEPDLDPNINKQFFENNFLLLDPQLMSDSGIKCFERFFKAVNSKEEKLKLKNRSYFLDDEDLIGKDYLWRVITMSNEEIAHKAIELLIEVSTALGPRLQATIVDFHENFIEEIRERLRTHYDNVQAITKSQIGEGKQQQDKNSHDMKLLGMEAEKMCRVLRVLQEYIKECDRAFNGERINLPLSRAHRGKHVTLYVRFNHAGRPIDDVEIVSHVNEMVSTLKRNLLKNIKGTSLNNIKMDFCYSNGELIDIADDRNPIGQYMFRDKTMLTAKLTPIGAGLSNSPDSSSESSTGSPPRPCPDVQRPDSERTLPGVIISHKPVFNDFFLKLYQLGADLELNNLRDSCDEILHLLPLDRLTIQNLNAMCYRPAGLTETDDKSIEIPTAESMFLHCNPAQVLYNLEVLHALLKPAVDPLNLSNLQFQSAWIHSGVAHFILELLTKNNFLPSADMYTKRSAFQNVLRLAKIFLYIVGCVLSKVGDEPTSSSDFDSGRSQIEILKSSLTQIFGNAEHTVRAMSSKLADNLATEMLSEDPVGDSCRNLFTSALQWSCPDLPTIKAIVQLAWASASGALQQLGTITDFSPIEATPEPQDQSICKDALEVLTISLVLNPDANEALSRDPIWPSFIISIVLINPMRSIRQQAAEQLYFSCTYCAGDWRPFVFTVKCLVDSLHTLVPKHADTCADYFNLLCRSLNYGCLYNWPLEQNDSLLEQEIGWLRSVKDVVRERGESQVHEDLLEGHLGLTKELMSYFPVDLKSQLKEFIVELVDDFLYPASRQYLHLRRTGQIVNAKGPPPVCRSPHTVAAASELVVALCQNSIPNMKLIVNTLVDMFFSDTEPLREWEYLSPVGPRPYRGFAGLKNAGATCYMNSVLQQLFMVPMIRQGILSASGATTDPNEDFSGESDSLVTDIYDETGPNRNQYHVGILKHVQAIFAHLGHSALQFYVPRGLWTHFKLQGEPVNLREQQDAVEFFMSLFESLDEGLKALGHQQLMGATLGGCFSDQKICQGCPHRYAKEEPFSVFSVDIRNHSSLNESLEQYVKGELLEGADAYHCDKCDKKVVTIKRLCVQKLPKVLAFQLKRFEYDYERVCAIKFNDYFEFPRNLNMEPYTVSGLAKLDNKMIELELDDETQPETNETTPTTYHLTGIVVHSGQASGGHYFSYILHKDPVTGAEQWYKFDDGEVTECKMHDDDELKAQCFGGDYMGEVYDNNLKRMQLRRQKRWWNAYMLFYTRSDQTVQPTAPTHIEQLSLAESRNSCLKIPAPIERSVRTQNLRFLHSRNLFAVEFFNFVRKLVEFRGQPNNEKLTPQAEELSLLAVQLASQFLFHSGFRTKKSLRGPAIDWYEDLKLPVNIWFDTLSLHIRNSAEVRRWFAQNVLLNPPSRLAEYILVAPSQEVRLVFVKFVALCSIFSGNDQPLPCFEGDNLCEQILINVLQLLKTDVADHGKHLPHYFQLFSMFASTSLQQKHQLLKLNVPAIFMKVAIDDGPGPTIKYPNVELGKLHQVVSILVRCCDLSFHCHTYNNGPATASEPLPNVYVDPDAAAERQLPPLSKEATEFLYTRTSYLKKVLEDTTAGEDGLKLIQYCCWENPIFSRGVLAELLWLCGLTGHHMADTRHHTEMLLNILLIEDTWQNHRIHNALKGVMENREGLFDIFERVKKNYPRHAYQVIKLLVQLFKQSRVAYDLLNSNRDVARPWALAVEWLQDSFERQRNVGNQYTYSSWSPPNGQGYENTNSGSSYILERTASTKNTLRLACELCPDEEQDEHNDSDAEVQDEVVNAPTVVYNSVDPANVTTNPIINPLSTPTSSSIIQAVPHSRVDPLVDTFVTQYFSKKSATDIHGGGTVTTAPPTATATTTNTSPVLAEDLDALEDLEISPKTPESALKSSQAAVLQQLNPKRRTPLMSTTTTAVNNELLPTQNLPSTPTPHVANQDSVVTSVSQYYINQPNELLSTMPSIATTGSEEQLVADRVVNRFDHHLDSVTLASPASITTATTTITTTPSATTKVSQPHT